MQSHISFKGIGAYFDLNFEHPDRQHCAQPLSFDYIFLKIKLINDITVLHVGGMALLTWGLGFFAWTGKRCFVFYCNCYHTVLLRLNRL